MHPYAQTNIQLFNQLRSEGYSKKEREYVREVRNAVGEKVEAYVARYDRMYWHPQMIRALRDALHELDPIDRDVLLMHLANELEHNLDLGALYVAREGWYQLSQENAHPPSKL